jgi:hypothetical protein
VWFHSGVPSRAFAVFEPTDLGLKASIEVNLVDSLCYSAFVDLFGIVICYMSKLSAVVE